MKKYPSIEQFRNVIRNVRHNHDFQGKDDDGNAIYAHDSNYPVLKFKGTVKLHGTNAGVVKYADGTIQFQSRERVLTIDSDNSNFAQQMIEKNLEFLFSDIEFKNFIAVYGEWCGGNIQKGVAINGLEKMFVIFGYLVDNVWIDIVRHDNKNQIFHIEQFPTFEIDIDFNHPELSQNKLIEMTISVEDKCPVGEFFGNIGVGEGIVFTSIDYPEMKFKSKGEKHSVSKVTKLNSIDTEALAEINQFVDLSVTENRLKQGIQYLSEKGLSADSKNTGEFLGWVVRDVLKEEGDTIIKSGFDDKKVKSAIVTKARIWFLNQNLILN